MSMSVPLQTDPINPRTHECIHLQKRWCWLVGLGITLIVLRAMATVCLMYLVGL
jgi:hypothetical protein